MSDLKLLIATSNAGKLQEYREILAGLPLTLIAPADLGLALDVQEDGDTFAANAQLKALAYAEASGLAVLADDSGLEVDALGGLPGVHSARYAGPGATDADRRRQLLTALEAIADDHRTARFRCVIALYWGGQVHLSDGAVEGAIGRQERGTGGFGYDSIFLVTGTGKTMAELTLEEKNAISHRGRAARAARALLVRLLQQLEPQPGSATVGS